ncbi:type 1 glutamine amidotransferase [bacterium]|nr:type 1 glutamine amidotransferase [bacterium]
MKIHYIQHVPFEGPALVESWARDRGHSIKGTLLYRGDALPDLGSFDLLVILGGPMNIYEDSVYSWLTGEKRFLEKAVAGGKTALGICLGAQLLADVLGGKVYKNSEPEIGWFPVSLTEHGEQSPVFGGLPKRFTAFHWHGDTFTEPPGGRITVETDCCAHQAFEYKGRVFGLQFHLESTHESIRLLIENSDDYTRKGRYIQKPEEMLSQITYTCETERSLDVFLDAVIRRITPDFKQAL